MKRFSLPRAGTLLLCLALLAGLLSGCALPASPQGLALSAMAAPLAAAVFPLSSGLPQVQADAGSGTLPCYYDSASGVCYYVCEDLCKASPTEYTYTLRAFSVRDGKIHTQTLATRTVFYSVSGQPYTSYRDFSGNPMTESDYIGYADRYFSQCTSVLLSPDGSLAAPGQSAQTTPASAPVPTPIPTPAPTPAPVPTSYSGPAPTVTKNPTNESLSVGGTTWFIAHAVNASKLTWQAVSPNGLVYTLSEALSLHPGLSLETEANDTLALRNVPFSLNGWGFQARFEGPGGVALSSVAYIFVADYITAYQGVLSAYRAAYQTGGHTAQYAVSNHLSVMIAHSPHVGYAFKDLDKDGTPELFIAGLGPPRMTVTISVQTIRFSTAAARVHPTPMPSYTASPMTALPPLRVTSAVRQVLRRTGTITRSGPIPRNRAPVIRSLRRACSAHACANGRQRSSSSSTRRLHSFVYRLRLPPDRNGYQRSCDPHRP